VPLRSVRRVSGGREREPAQHSEADEFHGAVTSNEAVPSWMRRYVPGVASAGMLAEPA